jgi:hypothetical protein
MWSGKTRNSVRLDIVDSQANAVYNTGLKRRGYMPVRLNITMEEAVYKRLKQQVPPKRMSAFISEAVRTKLYPDQKALDAAYKAARTEDWRNALCEDWAVAETEGWPE